MGHAADAGDECVACGARAVHDWRPVRTFDRRSARAEYPLRRCTACGTAVTGQRASGEAERLHSGGSYAHPPPAVDRLLEPLRGLGDRALLRAIGPLPPGTAVLDLGAGDGRVLDLLQRRGCLVSGVEPFAPPARAAAAIRRATVEEAAVAPATADVVLLWHVLEHLDDPGRAVAVAARAVRPGGRIVVSVPSIESLQSRLGRDRWFHLDVPRHAVHFSRPGLTRLLERCGLRVAAAGGVVVDQNLLGMTQTLLNLVTTERNVAFRALKGDRAGVPRRDLVVSVLAAPLASVAGLLAEWIADAAGRPGAIVVHAVREST